MTFNPSQVPRKHYTCSAFKHGYTEAEIWNAIIYAQWMYREYDMSREPIYRYIGHPDPYTRDLIEVLVKPIQNDTIMVIFHAMRTGERADNDQHLR